MPPEADSSHLSSLPILGSDESPSGDAYLLPSAVEGVSKRKLEYMASLMAQAGREVNPGPVFDAFFEERPLKIPALTSKHRADVGYERKKRITTQNSFGFRIHENRDAPIKSSLEHLMNVTDRDCIVLGVVCVCKNAYCDPILCLSNAVSTGRLLPLSCLNAMSSSWLSVITEMEHSSLRLSHKMHFKS